MELPGALEPLARNAAQGALFLDFDGTLSPIVDDPALARPLEGVPALLGRLGSRFGVVAVVSGRPAAFLARHLGRPAGVRLIGLYGLEEVGATSGPTVGPAELARWRPVMEGMAARAEGAAPPGVSVERKGLGFTLHFRAAPSAGPWALAFADEERRRQGAVVQEGRMAVELRPGIATDKGTVVEALGVGRSAACCFGDDLGDLAAFAALDALGRSGVPVVRVAVCDAESPAEVSAAADVIVEGPEGAMDLLGALVASVPG